MSPDPAFATPADAADHGEYRARRAGDERPLYRFAGRITADGSSGYPAEAGRYHLYAGWFCPWSQRVTIQRALNGLQDAISVSYVHGERDGRGWAFREPTGPDPVNGFRLLREAYEATEPGFDGHVSVPTLWDRATRRIVSNDYRTIGLDLATQFGARADTYPVELRDDIEEVDRWLGPAVNHGLNRIGSDFLALAELLDAVEGIEETLSHHRYLLGDHLTEADVRLWVSLVRLDAALEAAGQEVRLAEFPTLWAYARDLYRQPAFADTTDLAVVLPASANPLDWTASQPD